MQARVSLLADLPSLVTEVAKLRWREWGKPPEPADLDWWIEATTREAGRTIVPVTFVASTGDVVLGAVGLGEFDIEERRDRSPWVLGLVVRAEFRGAGIGRILLGSLADWAATNTMATVWAATGHARDFYERCGWTAMETVYCQSQGQSVTVLRLEVR